MAGNPSIGSLYVKMTEPRTNGRTVTLPGALDMMGKLSLTSQFKVSLHLARSNRESTKDLLNHLTTTTNVLDKEEDVVKYDFLCSDASIPGVSFNSNQELGSRQGIIENFPSYRVFPPFEVTFYVDSEFKIIRLFEAWVNYINPLYTVNNTEAKETKLSGMGSFNSRNEFFRFRYPDTYKRTISISKFERNFNVVGSNTVRDVPTVTYRMLEAYPDQINSIPVNYDGSLITKTTIRFLYSRYIIEYNPGKDNDTPFRR